MKVLAIDWSGREKRAAEHIWLAVVDAGRLVELENGRDRGEVVDGVVWQATVRTSPDALLDVVGASIPD